MKRKRTPLNRKRMLTDPTFELSRQNSAEFTRAVTAARLLNQALKPGLTNTAHQYTSGRLTKTMFKVLQGDLVNGRGERRVPQGQLSSLERFDFNRNISLQNVFKVPYSIILNMEVLQVTITFPSFIPRAMIDMVSGANAFMLTALAASTDLEKKSFPAEPRQTKILDLNLQRHENLQLQMPVIEHQPDNIIIVALGIEFFLSERERFEHLDKKHNALAVVQCFKP